MQAPCTEHRHDRVLQPRLPGGYARDSERGGLHEDLGRVLRGHLPSLTQSRSEGDAAGQGPPAGGILRSTRPEWWQHSAGLASLRCGRQGVHRRGGDDGQNTRDAQPHHHEPEVRWLPRRGCDPLRGDHGPGDRRRALGAVPVGGEAGGALFEDRQGSGRGEGWRAADEGHAGVGRLAGSGCRCWHLRHQGAICDQALQPGGHQGHCTAAVRHRKACLGQGLGAHLGAGGGHTCVGQGGLRAAVAGPSA
mmetsp:Transcript_128238/g.409989  ORF Transcript_128238/g.409989 Transcript_128238/m.409989 type:complete len:249 (-) Transcript_128238:621-1367(-)